MLGQRNSYHCSGCGKALVTIDRAEGVTPFMMKCVITRGCAGYMHSSFYNPPPQLQAVEPCVEWYAPEQSERCGLGKFELQHVDNGGLLMRKLPNFEEEKKKAADLPAPKAPILKFPIPERKKEE